MSWRRPGILILANRGEETMNAAERIIKNNGCVVSMRSIYGRYDSFQLRKGSTYISPQFHTLTELCNWVIENNDEIFRRVEQCQ